MATKKATKREMEARHEGKIARAWGVNMTDGMDYKMIRAAVYAVVPGKQKHKNIKALLDAAVSAACRTIRRR